MEFFFAKIVNKFQPLTIVAKNTSLQILGKMMFEYIFKKKKKNQKDENFLFQILKAKFKAAQEDDSHDILYFGFSFFL